MRERCLLGHHESISDVLSAPLFSLKDSWFWGAYLFGLHIFHSFSYLRARITSVKFLATFHGGPYSHSAAALTGTLLFCGFIRVTGKKISLFLPAQLTGIVCFFSNYFVRFYSSFSRIASAFAAKVCSYFFFNIIIYWTFFEFAWCP